MNNNRRNLYIVLGIAALMAVLIVPDVLSSSKKMSRTYVPISQFYEYVKNDKVGEVIFYDSDARFVLKETGEVMYTIFPQNLPQLSAMDIVKNYNVDLNIRHVQGASFGLAAISWLLTVILPIGFIIYIIYKMRSGGTGISNFIHGESKFKDVQSRSERPDNKFTDIAGVNEAVDEISELVEYLKNPDRFKQMGARIPKGCLLCGPPGTGKTLLARCVAGEAGVPFFATSGSEFTEIFVGLGAKRVRDLFINGRRQSPCIIFIDEIDAIGRRRGKESPVGGNDERESTLNQLLVEMDGFTANSGIIVIAATNIPDVLDNALLRPGRFDRKIYINLPDIQGRIDILNVSIKKSDVKLSPDIDVRAIARSTPGFSGADLDNLINEAAIIAAKHAKLRVEQEDIVYARDKITMGAERRSIIITEETNKITAYHESGHALISLKMPNTDPLCKVSIIPRGRAMGVTINAPESDRYFYRKNELYANIVMTMGGRAAETIIFGDDAFTSGASNDFMQATNTAYAMVTELGMSDTIGPMRLVKEDHQFMPRHSDETAKLVDAEVKGILERAMSDAKRILNDNIEQLHLLANALLEYETLEASEVNELLTVGDVNFKKVKTTEKQSGSSVIPDFE